MSLLSIHEDGEVSTNVVNLDALIPREDFAVGGTPSKATPLDRISITHLDKAGYFVADLRKPDFQRETTHWTPEKVVDLIRSFVDADLIPAVILWRAGSSIFVIDGAHRLSALLAWITDDYGDRRKSLDFLGGYVGEDQRKVAERTRHLVNTEVGSYAQYEAFRNNRGAASPKMQVRLSNLADNALVAQWVTATDGKSAQASFFKINQQGTPIDPTERRLLRSRSSASAISARAITHAGVGHKYWGNFAPNVQVLIESGGQTLHKALYDPPISANALTTLDVPVGGRGYNALPFIFDLVNQANDVKVPDSKKAGKDSQDILPSDNDGKETVRFIGAVKKTIGRITGDGAASLGLHPIVYFYTRSGTFQPTFFLSVAKLVSLLVAMNQLEVFTRHRRCFEEFLIEKKST